MKLQEDGIYALPDGREVIVRTSTLGPYLLHDLNWGVAAAPLYSINEAGHLLSWGRITCWTMKDLQNTGRTSLPLMKQLQIV